MSDSELEVISKKCAHLIYHADSVNQLQALLLEVNDPLSVLAFPSACIPKSDRTFLMACARRGRYECCKLLLSLDSASSVNVQNGQGYTALHYASYEGHVDVGFLLLAAGADVELRNIHNETAYETAMSGKRTDLVHMYQQSHYFTNYISKNAVLPSSNNGTNFDSERTNTKALALKTNDVRASSYKGLSKQDASYYVLYVTEVGQGADQSVIGSEFACLASVQQATNKARPTALSGSVHEAAGLMEGSLEDLYIGRARTNHVCIGDLSLSKQHAVISYFEDRGFVVRDIGSKHGTFIDEQRLHSESVEGEVMVAAEKKKSDGKNGDCFLKGKEAHNSKSDTKAVARAPQYLKEGMVVRFGRISCTVVRKRQDFVLSSG